MNKRKGTYRGNFDFSDLIREAMQGHYARKKNWADEFEKTAQSSEPAWKTWTRSGKPDKQMDIEMVNVEAIHWNWVPRNPLVKLQAPKGWDNYLIAGDFKGCRPIIKPGAKVNYNCPSFETINFEMA